MTRQGDTLLLEKMVVDNLVSMVNDARENSSKKQKESELNSWLLSL
jgi:hypothetical protein